eukprot:CAMPEP_0204216502 /NCGR_PEP_ID=MMETSP0361-20130328/78241_1 /ASSEMBLY_ACC=CAM_ASM_000343 /TAXON_ID=268821 /ORGANISM="Scrippsiella Hangoei, Strain SHTV-5" /LENGTH=211 /DNA_ID=CAMNT_0051181385 /DNA_START=71 /DNA_END=707 /DNA_ORIENTATION=-
MFEQLTRTVCFLALLPVVAASYGLADERKNAAVGDLGARDIILLLSYVRSILLDAYRFDPSEGKVAACYTDQEIRTACPPISVCDAPCCVICLEDVGAEEDGVQLKCGHPFHADCIKAWWMSEKRTSLQCPTCRQTHLRRAAAEKEESTADDLDAGHPDLEEDVGHGHGPRAEELEENKFELEQGSPAENEEDDDDDIEMQRQPAAKHLTV